MTHELLDDMYLSAPFSNDVNLRSRTLAERDPLTSPLE